MRIQAENRAYRIGEVMALSDTAYYAYRRELQNRPPAEGNRREPEGGRTFLLAMGEDGEDGVVVDLTGGRYEGLPVSQALRNTVSGKGSRTRRTASGPSPMKNSTSSLTAQP